MSLIVARKEITTDGSESLIIASDTKLTAGNSAGGGALHWRDGAVKTSILSNELAVSWAGGTDFADQALKKFSSNNFLSKSRDAIIDFFWQKHLDSLKETSAIAVDFILTFGDSQIEIIKISNGNVTRNCDRAFIGSESAFNLFRSQMEKDLSEPYLSSKMLRAMQFVIQADKIQEVGDFAVIVLYSSSQGFIFRPRFESINKSQKLYPGVNQIGIGDAASGSYCVSLNICLNNKNALAFYFNQGCFGLLFATQDNGILKVVDEKEIKVRSPDEFTRFVLEKYALNVPICFK